MDILLIIFASVISIIFFILLIFGSKVEDPKLRVKLGWYSTVLYIVLCFMIGVPVISPLQTIWSFKYLEEIFTLLTAVFLFGTWTLALLGIGAVFNFKGIKEKEEDLLDCRQAYIERGKIIEAYKNRFGNIEYQEESDI